MSWVMRSRSGVIDVLLENGPRKWHIVLGNHALQTAGAQIGIIATTVTHPTCCGPGPVTQCLEVHPQNPPVVRRTGRRPRTPSPARPADRTGRVAGSADSASRTFPGHG